MTAAPLSVVLLRARNEGVYLLDWIAHYRAIGFDRIAVVTHDLTDGSDVLLGALADAGILDWTDCSAETAVTDGPPNGPVTRASRRLVSEKYADFDWLYVADADEFLVLAPGQLLPDWLAGFPDFSQILLPSYILGRPPDQTLAGTQPPSYDGPWVGRLDALIKSLRRIDAQPAVSPHFRDPDLSRIALPDQKPLPKDIAEILSREKAGASFYQRTIRESAAETWEAAANAAHFLHFRRRSAEEFVVCRALRGTMADNWHKNTGATYLRQLEKASNSPRHETDAVFNPSHAQERAGLAQIPGVAEAETACFAWYNVQLQEAFLRPYPTYQVIREAIAQQADEAGILRIATEVSKGADADHRLVALVELAVAAKNAHALDDCIEAMEAFGQARGGLGDRERAFIARAKAKSALAQGLD